MFAVFGSPCLPCQVEPSPDHIESLVAMGFDRDRSIAALRAAGDNLELAANRLLSG